MECREFEQLTPLFLDGELTDAEADELVAHAEGCTSCAETLEREQRFHSLLRQRLRPTAAPPELRRAVMQEMRRTRRPLLMRLGLGSLAAAAAAAALVFMWGPWTEGAIPGPLQAAMVRTGDASLPLDVASDQPAELHRFFERRLPFKLDVPRLPATFKVRGGRMTYLREAPTAVLRYEINGAPVSLYVFRDPRTRSFLAADPHRVRLLGTQRDRHRAVVWEQRGVVYSLVGDVSEDLLTELKHAITPPR
jgi:anti-sigma factor (TIGR02949 family)